ncbi:hypothetical protein M413DRAFT_28429 [Hebeloma cylindrosporum]|uniref:Uncharacterized protein n=1 Tax=Hebeloma cylindrosporum TaxID=76867 RepID=A0A0C2YHX3_HEBCY|nr:hypothetical protein M413DRAFT_28429 [Hebeloma cylindrosporum h7]
MTINDAQPSTEEKLGRVLIGGGTDWPKLGRKERGRAAVEEIVEPECVFNAQTLSRFLASSVLAKVDKPVEQRIYEKAVALRIFPNPIF